MVAEAKSDPPKKAASGGVPSLHFGVVEPNSSSNNAGGSMNSNHA